jgi:hypothetical protein
VLLLTFQVDSALELLVNCGRYSGLIEADVLPCMLLHGSLVPRDLGRVAAAVELLAVVMGYPGGAPQYLGLHMMVSRGCRLSGRYVVRTFLLSIL